MQSGYGGVSEFQQFIMDGAFSMSAPPPPPPQQQQQQPQPAPAGVQELGGPFRYQPLHHHALPPQHHHHAPHPHMPPHFAHFGAGPPAAGGIPFTQQLLHQAAAAGHHLQLFHEQQHHHQHQHHKPQPAPPQHHPHPAPARWTPQQHHQPHPHHHHLGFDVEATVPESSGPGGGSAASGGAAPPGVPPFLAAAMNFKLAVDAGGGSGATGGTDDALNDGGGGGSGMMLHVGGGDDEAATESRLRRWPGDEETSIKEPTWRPLDIDYLHSSTSSSKRAGKEKVATPESPAPAAAANYFKKGDDNASAAAASASAGGGNYKLFSELEAIYKPGSGGAGGAQTGSGSGLTGDDNAILEPAMTDLPGAAAADAPQLNTSETSAGEDAAAVVQQQPQPSADAARRKRKRRRQEQLSASASFFERLVQRLMEHQESLHHQFLDAMERRERERAARDEAWRLQEAEKFAREAAARAQDRASAAAREAAIIAYLEKISGESITLPPPADDINQDAAASVGKELMPYDGGDTAPGSGSAGALHFSTSRWPKHEVEALIRVRTGLDGRFQEPGLKGPLWEEVSTRMAAAGYGRSAKRCKEKWENINKYFRKAKESGKKRPAQAKTCPYFDELDRLYSRSGSGGAQSSAAGNTNAGTGEDAKASSELLDAVVKYPDVHYGPPGFVFDREQSEACGGGNEGRDHDAADDGNGAAHDDEEDGIIGRGRASDDPEDEVESHGHDDH
ncbi:trihelix transcription factor GTL1-like [Phragmites australis]|uniref:trihelix transcription factor GTL1-like n=1 Tax=Phragmites australis TaxID=29695 RepID=UPI002D781F7F|nr:trihelix transcription factor GTL1-like [Phragmites australis]